MTISLQPDAGRVVFISGGADGIDRATGLAFADGGQPAGRPA